MKIGEIAKKAGLKPSAIRYYERMGLLRPATRVGGRRLFGPEILNQIALIQVGGRLGFSLAELKSMLRFIDKKHPRENSARRMVGRKIEEINRLIEGAVKVRALLTQGMNCDCRGDLSICSVARQPADLPPIGWQTGKKVVPKVRP